MFTAHTPFFHPVHRLTHSRRGNSAVEFALLGPLMLAMLMGTIEVGRVLWVRGTLQFAVEETARYAMVHTGAADSDLIAHTHEQLLGLASIADEVTVTVNRDTANSTSFVTVEATTPMTFLTSFFPDGALTLSGTARASLNP